MKTLNVTIIFLMALGFATAVKAQPVIDTLTVQGYLKRANGTAVTNGTYNIAFGVRQNGTTIWARQLSTTVTNGLFSANLSGTGTDLSALPAGTGMNANYSAITLNPALLEASGNGAIVVRVYGVSTIDGSNPQFDISIGAVPTAFMAGIAQSVQAGSVTAAGIATASKTATSAGIADAGKIVLLNGSGLIDSSMISSLTVAQGGTGAATHTAGSLIVGNGTSAFASLAAGTTGNLVYATGATTWASGTPDAAGVVDKTSTQTVAGNKTWSGNQQVNGTFGVGSTLTGTGIADFSNLKRCSGSVAAFNVGTGGTGINNTMTCNGATTSMGVHCTPAGGTAIANTPWWVARVTAANTVTITVISTGTTGTEVAAATWYCMLY